LEGAKERSACYDQLRSDLLKPPVKGPDFRYWPTSDADINDLFWRQMVISTANDRIFGLRVAIPHP
jgi:hypothetical protein